ncbi:hypothetical protein [Streptomyces sp. NPDC048057]|uniref:hypothetical protein n=1 Tax=Streptomyces sp. NPDC048057 TaxID=3155628 RepID=UPI0033E9C968
MTYRRPESAAARTGTARRVLVGLLAALMAIAPAGTTAAQGEQPAPHQLYDALGVTDVHTRYVVLLDTTSVVGTRLFEIRTQLTTLLNAAGRTGDITLILFDRKVRRTISPLTPEHVHALRATEPLPPDDTIDVPGAVDAALTVLERDLPPRAALVVLAAGRQGPDASAGTDPATVLRRRADAIAARTTLTVHAFPLAWRADTRARHIAVLERAFPAKVTGGSWTPWVRPDLAHVKDDVLRRAALTALARDRSGQVVAEWPKEASRLSLTAEKATVTLTLRSTMTKVPLLVSDLKFTMTDDPTPISVKADVGRGVELKPGATVQVPVKLAWKTDKWGMGRETVRLSGRLSVQGRVSSPWDPHLTAVGIHTAPVSLRHSSTTVAGTGTVGIAAWVLWAVGGGASGLTVLLAVLAVWAAFAERRNHPRLHGWLTAQYPEDDQGTWVERQLGPVALVGRRELETEELYPSGEGTVHVRPGPDERGEARTLYIRCRPHDAEQLGDEGRCPVDGTVIISGVQFVHHRAEPVHVRGRRAGRHGSGPAEDTP